MSRQDFIRHWRDQGYCVVERGGLIYLFQTLNEVYCLREHTGSVDHVTQLPRDVWTDLFVAWLQELGKQEKNT